MFLVNIALARTRQKEEYGVFALTYSMYTFLAGLHNAVILEAYTIHGSGRYSAHFNEYARLFWRKNAQFALLLTGALILVFPLVIWSSPVFKSYTTLGMALSCGVLLTASFLRRTFYIRRRPDLAAKFSAAFFSICAILLIASMWAKILTGFFAFLVVGVSWICAALAVRRDLEMARANQDFVGIDPEYWAEHWKYSRWVLMTALVFQLTTQGYYWLSAAFLTVKEVADIRAMYNLITPVEQLFIAMVLLILPAMSSRYSIEGKTGLLRVWRRYCIACLLVTCVFAGFLKVFAARLMHVLYAGKFDDVVPLVGILALLPIVMGVGNTMNAALKAMERPKAVFYGYLASGASTVLIGLPLIVRLGLRGAVYGMLISAGTYTVALGTAFLYFSGTKLPVAAVAGVADHDVSL